MRHNLDRATREARIAAGATAIVAGTALLCNLRVWRAIGPFDERFFAYWEDTDYSVRSALAGFTNTVVLSTTVAHAATAPDRRPPHYHYYMIRNEALFWRLHGRTHHDAGWRRRWLAEALEAIARGRDLGHSATVAAGVDALWHVWRERYGPRDAHAPAPRWFHGLIAMRPWLLAGLVRGEYGALARRLRRIMKPHP